MKSITAQFTGIRPVIMHNGMLADPTYPFTVAIKEITDKGSKKMTLADHERRNALEWEGGLYWDDDLGPHIPSDNIERCIQLGAQKSRLGKDVQAAMWCSQQMFAIEYTGPRTKAKLMADSAFTIRKGVVVNKSRIIRIRPMFPTGWKVKFSIEYDETVVNGKDLIKAMQDAGALIGLGDWRPKFGRFTVAILEGAE